jgi:hypothetical protein
MTVPGVVKEFGSLSELKHIEVINIKEIISVKQDTDRHLIDAAEYLQLPIIYRALKLTFMPFHLRFLTSKFYLQLVF